MRRNHKYYSELMVNKAEEYMVTIGKSKMIAHFGKEYRFDRGTSDAIYDAVLNKFIKKYDKRFKEHIKKEGKNVSLQSDRIIMLKPEKATYIYIATGMMVGNIETRFLMNQEIGTKDIYMYIFGRGSRKYHKELDDLINAVYNMNDLGLFIIDKAQSRGYGDERDGESLDVSYAELQPRSLNTLFFSDGEKELIQAHIDSFNANIDFYKDRQLLYKTGILFSGEPGTGKSSLVKALATEYHRSICSINVSNIANIDLNKLAQAINADEVRKYIVLLEDVDTLFLNRVDGKSDKEDQAIINKLLQFLDSNTSPNDVIFIATTNHVDRLDEALLREGRFDLKVDIAALELEDAITFGESFTMNREQMIDICAEIKALGKCNAVGRYNQSTLQAMILSKINKKSLEQTVAMYGEMEDSSEVKAKELEAQRKKEEESKKKDDDDIFPVKGIPAFGPGGSGIVDMLVKTVKEGADEDDEDDDEEVDVDVAEEADSDDSSDDSGTDSELSEDRSDNDETEAGEE